MVCGMTVYCMFLHNQVLAVVASWAFVVLCIMVFLALTWIPYESYSVKIEILCFSPFRNLATLCPELCCGSCIEE
jgi:hypothetical protein